MGPAGASARWLHGQLETWNGQAERWEHALEAGGDHHSLQQTALAPGPISRDSGVLTSYTDKDNVSSEGRDYRNVVTRPSCTMDLKIISKLGTSHSKIHKTWEIPGIRWETGKGLSGCWTLPNAPILHLINTNSCSCSFFFSLPGLSSPHSYWVPLARHFRS